jgi:peptidoglycan/LPS O-acetylase OafA/YrhL
MDVTKLSIEIEFKICFFLFYGVLRVAGPKIQFEHVCCWLLLISILSLLSLFSLETRDLRMCFFFFLAAYKMRQWSKDRRGALRFFLTQLLGIIA